MRSISAATSAVTRAAFISAGEQIGGALGNVGEHGLGSPSPMAVCGFADAAEPQRLQLDGGKLRIGMVAQGRKQRERGAFDGLVVGVQRFRASCPTPPHSACFLRITHPRIMA
jgi:hypothetical protein